MINGITLQSLRNPEFLQFMSDTLTIVSKNDPQALLVLNQYNALKAITTEVDALFKKEAGSAITDELTALDDVRDGILNGISTMILGSTFHFNPALKKSALLLQANIVNYGTSGNSISRENYLSETAIITSLIADWTNKPELAAAITALGLDEWKTQLDTANINFNARHVDRTQAIGAINPNTTKEKRQETVAIYYKLRDRLTSYWDINEKADPWNKTTNELNALIDIYNKLINGRKGGDTPTPTPPPAPAPVK